MIVDSRGMVLTEEVLSQCFSICLVLISCGTVSAGSAADGGDMEEVVEMVVVSY